MFKYLKYIYGLFSPKLHPLREHRKEALLKVLMYLRNLVSNEDFDFKKIVGSGVAKIDCRMSSGSKAIYVVSVYKYNDLYEVLTPQPVAWVSLTHDNKIIRIGFDESVYSWVCLS